MLESLSYEAANVSSIQVFDDTSVYIFNSRSATDVAGARFQTREGNLVISALYSKATGTGGTHIGNSILGGVLQVQNSLLVGGSNGVLGSGGSVQVSNSEIRDISISGLANRPNLNAILSASFVKVKCSGSTGVAVQQGIALPSNPLMFNSTGGGTTIIALDVNACAWAVRAIGPSWITFPTQTSAQSTGAPTGVGLESRSGAMILVDPSMIQWTAPPVEVSLDNGAATTTLSAISASSCLSSGFGSRVCKQ